MTFHADVAQLVTNADTYRDHADQLRRWIDTYDDPAHYARLEESLGVIAHPVITALRQHGAQLRGHAETLIASYEQTGEASRRAAAMITAADDTQAAGVSSTTSGLSS